MALSMLRYQKFQTVFKVDSNDGFGNQDSILTFRNRCP